MWFASAIALIIATGTGGEAKERKAVVTKTYAQSDPAQPQQQNRAKLRYYGGPKSPMFSE
jgi:hypothetical protein